MNNLSALFRPQSIAVIGASTKERSLGRVIAQNLASGGFTGPIAVVSPKYRDIAGLPTYSTLQKLPQVPDLVVVTVPPEAVPATIEEAGAAGVKAAVVITAGLGQGPGSCVKRPLLQRANLGSAWLVRTVWEYWPHWQASMPVLPLALPCQAISRCWHSQVR
jgi:acyl-CoA synthetase (NDP forming)